LEAPRKVRTEADAVGRQTARSILSPRPDVYCWRDLEASGKVRRDPVGRQTEGPFSMRPQGEAGEPLSDPYSRLSVLFTSLFPPVFRQYRMDIYFNDLQIWHGCCFI